MQKVMGALTVVLAFPLVLMAWALHQGDVWIAWVAAVGVVTVAGLGVVGLTHLRDEGLHRRAAGALQGDAPRRVRRRWYALAALLMAALLALGGYGVYRWEAQHSTEAGARLIAEGDYEAAVRALLALRHLRGACA